MSMLPGQFTVPAKAAGEVPFEWDGTNAAGEKSDVQARYTFVYEKRDGRWLIQQERVGG